MSSPFLVLKRQERFLLGPTWVPRAVVVADGVLHRFSDAAAAAKAGGKAPGPKQLTLSRYVARPGLPDTDKDYFDLSLQEAALTLAPVEGSGAAGGTTLVLRAASPADFYPLVVALQAGGVQVPPSGGFDVRGDAADINPLAELAAAEAAGRLEALITALDPAAPPVRAAAALAALRRAGAAPQAALVASRFAPVLAVMRAHGGVASVQGHAAALLASSAARDPATRAALMDGGAGALLASALRAHASPEAGPAGSGAIRDCLGALTALLHVEADVEAARACGALEAACRAVQLCSTVKEVVAPGLALFARVCEVGDVSHRGLFVRYNATSAVKSAMSLHISYEAIVAQGFAFFMLLEGGGSDAFGTPPPPPPSSAHKTRLLDMNMHVFAADYAKRYGGAKRGVAAARAFTTWLSSAA